jgi:tRNA dimethylallyltransferase
MKGRPRAILIAGPTASGKSRFALALAEAEGGTLINADASQVYTELRILTARPSAEDEALAPHLLYGHVPARERYSVARWLADVRRAVASAEQAGRMPILVGGTGLYFRAALEGLADTPPIPPEVRQQAAALYGALGAQGFRAQLAALDPEAAATIAPKDRYRALRAYEVAAATGKPLSHWFKGAHRPLFDTSEVMRLALMPERAELYQACEARLDAMVAAGALEEVRALLRLDLGPTLPAMKAVGVEEFARVLCGEIDLATALIAAKRRTRNFAKRQLTWIRNQMADWRQLPPSDSSHPIDELLDAWQAGTRS